MLLLHAAVSCTAKANPLPKDEDSHWNWYAS